MRVALYKVVIGMFFVFAGNPSAFSQNYAGYWLGVTYPSDPTSTIFNYFGNFTQSGNVLEGTAQTSNPKVAFGGEAAIKGTVTATTVKFKESDPNGSLNTPLTCYWDLNLVYNAAEESLKGTYTNIQNPPYCSEVGGGKVELYRIVPKSVLSYCKGQPVNLTVTGKSIRWYDSQNKTRLLATGNSFTPQIDQSTVFYITQTLYNTESPPIPLRVEIVDVAFTEINAKNPTCGQANGQLSILAAGSNEYQFSLDGTNYQPGSVFSNLQGGEYTVYMKEGRGCTASQKVTLAPSGVAKITSVQATPTTCGREDGSVTIATAAANVQFSMDGTLFQSEATFKNVRPGNYTVTMKDAAGCMDTKPILVAASAGPKIAGIDLAPVSCGAADGQITVRAEGTNLSYATSTRSFSASNSFDNMPPGEYEILIKDAENCSASQKVVLSTDCANTVFIPTSFSPNSDGHNDLLTVYFPFATLQFSSLRIYDRWGIAIHSGQNLTLRSGDALWDGGLDKMAALADTYYTVVADVVFADGSTHTFTKEVLAIR
jgi:gliding motility-associated-like protein